MTTLTVTRGIPASGKTTWAQAQNTPTVCRDDLRKSVFGLQCKGVLGRTAEATITTLQESMVRDLLKNGSDVIVADMNLRAAYVRRWQKIALELGAEFVVKDFPITLDEALSRNANRTDSVPENVIRDLHRKFGDLRPVDLSLNENSVRVRQYTPLTDKPRAVIVDIDGTVANLDGRDPYDYSDAVLNDKPRKNIIELVNTLSDAGYAILFVSGRKAMCYWDTWVWLARHTEVVSFALYMRRDGDNRRDRHVKYEIFDNDIRDNYNVAFVLDDRKQVVDMWRELGLDCLQVAEGNF